MAIYLKIRIIYVALVDMGTLADAIVFKSVRFQMSTLIRYVCVSICIHFQQRFQIDAFSVNTLSVFKRISVDGRPKRINLYAFSNENALVWTGPYLTCEKCPMEGNEVHFEPSVPLQSGTICSNLLTVRQY